MLGGNLGSLFYGDVSVMGLTFNLHFSLVCGAYLVTDEKFKKKCHEISPLCCETAFLTLLLDLCA